MNNIPLSFFYSWQNVPEEYYGNVMREFRDNGVENLVLDDFLLKRVIHEPHIMLTLKNYARVNGVRFFEVHGLWSTGYDMVCTDKGRRPYLIADQKLAMNYAAELGCKNYVMHIGAYESVYFQTPNEELRPNGIEVLEQLLPEAEKLGIILALENSYEVSNTPDEVLYYIRYFDHDNLGSCLDAGHANVMAPGPGKRNELYHPDVLEAWNGKVVQYDHAFEKLAPYIVTMHLHDNSGFEDSHKLPGLGTINWKELAEKIRTLPRLTTLQSEVKTGSSSSWSIRSLAETFHKLFPYADTTKGK